MPNIFTRRRLIASGLGIGGAALLSACTPATGHPVGPFVAPAAPTFGSPTVEATLRAGATEVDLGGISATTWAYDGRIPGKELRAKAGDVLKIHVQNTLPTETLFRVALGGHVMTVTHTDGYPVQPTETRALYLAQGERADVLVTLADGVFRWSLPQRASRVRV